MTLGANRVVTTSGGVLMAVGVISGAGLSLTKASGRAALVLAGVNAFTGGMILNAGELDINNAAAIGTGTFTINGGVIDNTSGRGDHALEQQRRNVGRELHVCRCE